MEDLQPHFADSDFEPVRTDLALNIPASIGTHQEYVGRSVECLAASDDLLPQVDSLALLTALSPHRTPPMSLYFRHHGVWRRLLSYARHSVAGFVKHRLCKPLGSLK
jgi:hypothetical protein